MDNRMPYFMDNLPMVMRVEDLMPVLKIGRNSAYALVRSGQIRCIRIGKAIRIPREAVMDFLNGTTN